VRKRIAEARNPDKAFSLAGIKIISESHPAWQAAIGRASRVSQSQIGPASSRKKALNYEVLKLGWDIPRWELPPLVELIAA
jgi:hypothetical protein